MRDSSRHHKLEEFCSTAANDEAKSYFGFPDDGGVSLTPSSIVRE
jgi:hypothetical protein